MSSHESHNHDTLEQELACEVAQMLSRQTGLPCIVAIVESEGEMARPCVSLRGNVTDIAHIVMAVLDISIAHGRPTECIACMTNYDAIARARAAMDAIVGRC